MVVTPHDIFEKKNRYFIFELLKTLKTNNSLELKKKQVYVTYPEKQHKEKAVISQIPSDVKIRYLIFVLYNTIILNGIKFDRRQMTMTIALSVLICKNMDLKLKKNKCLGLHNFLAKLNNNLKMKE